VIKYDQISTLFKDDRNNCRYEVSIYIQNSKNMRDGVHKICGSSDGRAVSRRDLSGIQKHIYLTLLEAFNRRESDVGGKIVAFLCDIGGQ
jgi:hypothetical protein